MTRTANYLIAQHMPDLFRRESRNIGVFVRIDKEIKSKFFGETEPSVLDARKTKVLPAPDVYAHWVRYWRRVAAQRPGSAWDEIQKTAKEHYQVIDGGVLDGIGDDSIEEVTNFLFLTLVSEGGIASALGAPDESEAAMRLAEVVEADLKKLNLLEKGKDLFSTVQHPVIRDRPVQGHDATHLISFFQTGDHDLVVEPIDITVRRDRKRMEERAGWASRVFGDIREKNKDTRAIAIVSATAEEEKEPSAEYALRLLRPLADVVNWQSDHDRKQFLEDRRKQAA